MGEAMGEFTARLVEAGLHGSSCTLDVLVAMRDLDGTIGAGGGTMVEKSIELGLSGKPIRLRDRLDQQWEEDRKEGRVFDVAGVTEDEQGRWVFHLTEESDERLRRMYNLPPEPPIDTGPNTR